VLWHLGPETVGLRVVFAQSCHVGGRGAAHAAPLWQRDHGRAAEAVVAVAEVASCRIARIEARLAGADNFGSNALAGRGVLRWRRRRFGVLPGWCSSLPARLRARRRLAAEAELARHFLCSLEARLLDLQRFAGARIAGDLREGGARLAVRGPDRIGAIESDRHIGTAEASSDGPDQLFGTLRFADATGGSDIRNVAAGEDGHSAAIETSGHGTPGTIRERFIEMLDPLLRREIRMVPPGLHPSPVGGNGNHGQAAQPQTNRPFATSTGHSRSPMLWIGTPARMIGCRPVGSTRHG
jgi:hypothetical protein